MENSRCSVTVITSEKQDVTPCAALPAARRLVEFEYRQWKKESNDTLGPIYILVISFSQKDSFEYLSYYEPPLREFSEDYLRIFDRDGYSLVGGKTDDVFKTFCDHITIYYRRTDDE